MNNGKRYLFVYGFILFVALGGVYARGNTEIPQAEIKTSGTQYISPDGDDVQETATIDFEVTVYVKSAEGYIPEYGISISDESGTVIRQIIVKSESDVGWFLRIFRAYQAFTLTRSETWDGKDSDGNVVPDGTYTIAMWIIAGSDQRTDLDLDNFVIDTEAPTLTISDPVPLIFSPENKDGNLDTLTIAQSGGTDEDLWEGSFLNESGTAIMNYEWSNGSPQDIIWDGLDDSGLLLANGLYSYQLSSTDRAGNSFSYSISGIELDNTPTPIDISLDNGFISPNNDGVKDVVAIDLSQEIDKDIVEWKVLVDNGDGVISRTYGGTTAPPQVPVVFDGMDDAAQPLDDGLYAVSYELKYRNGNNPVVSQEFVIDTLDPVITATVTSNLISPNGDGRSDETEISFVSNENVTWSGEISDPSGSTLLSKSLELITTPIVWPGTDLQDGALEDGGYSMEAVFTDWAGNTSTLQSEITVDLTPPEVTFGIDRDYFSPDGDGIKETIRASFTTSEPVRGELTIKDSSKRDAGTFGGLGRAVQPVSADFDYIFKGIAGSGVYLPDDKYSVENVFEDLAGNRMFIPALSFTIDTRKVAVSINAPTGFSPNGDNKQDELSIGISSLFYDTVESWKLSYIDALGDVMYVEEGTDTLPQNRIWDGGMQFAPDITASEGLYSAALSVEFKKGDIVEAISGSFFVDVTPPAISLQAAADPFAKAGEKDMEGDLFITLQIEDAHEVSDWALDVLSAENEIIRSFAGTGDLEGNVVWPDEQMARVPISEKVMLRISVVDEVGNESTFEQAVPLDLLIVKRDGKMYLLVPNVIFGAYQYALDSRSPEMLQRNLESIDRVKKIFDKYTRYDLVLEGHALNIYRGNEDREAAEEEILVPLTQNRAATVRDALAEDGMNEDRIRTEWFGGTQPIVDVMDREIRWKNRRVEFIMEERE